MTFQEKLSALKLSGQVVETTENDFFSCIKVLFDADITFNKIKARSQDINIFFDADVEISSSAGLIVFKIPKKSRGIIYTCDYLQGIADRPENIPLIIGQNETGDKIYADLTKMPHLLVAGSTGSGKSVFIHNCILSNLYSGKSALILVDVKRVEFSIYENIKHLATPIIYDSNTALQMLKSLCEKMGARYQTFKNSKCRNIEEYKKAGNKMLYITLIIDELADLMLSNKRIEYYLIRLAQLGRAAGIHLILATQRPDAQILSGLIRANVPSRISFAVQKSMDSRIILDMSGAEKLAGAGDGLYLPIESKNPIHFQSPFTSTNALIQIAELDKAI